MTRTVNKNPVNIMKDQIITSIETNIETPGVLTTDQYCLNLFKVKFKPNDSVKKPLKYKNFSKKEQMFFKFYFEHALNISINTQDKTIDITFNSEINF